MDDALNAIASALTYSVLPFRSLELQLSGNSSPFTPFYECLQMHTVSHAHGVSMQSTSAQLHQPSVLAFAASLCFTLLSPPQARH